MKKNLVITLAFIGIITLSPLFHAHANVGTIDPIDKYTKVCKNPACSTFGKVNFAPTPVSGATPIQITNTAITGYAWGDEIGWINFNPSSGGVSVNSTSGELSGYAYANTGGWINFKPTTIPGGTPVGVKLVKNNLGGTDFYGWAYVSGINGGWLYFDCGNPVQHGFSNCVRTSYIFPELITIGGGGSSLKNFVEKQQWCDEKDITFTQTLKKGDVDGNFSFKSFSKPSEVAKLQKYLKSFGYTVGPVDGNFGSLTLGALVAFQKANGITTAGIFDKQTRTLILEKKICPGKTLDKKKDNNGDNNSESSSNQEKESKEVKTENSGDKKDNSSNDSGKDNVLVNNDKEKTPEKEALSCPYFTEYVKLGYKGNEVIKIRKFLNEYRGESLPTDSNLADEEFVKAVKRFQESFMPNVLVPWGLEGSTGWWYQSTRKNANDMVGCGESVLLDNGVYLK